MSSKTIKVKVKAHPVVVMEAEVARQIRQHSRTSMKAEVCGVLIGSSDDERTLIEACIAGINAAQGGAHVTFTQDTWEHIYKIKDEQFPEKKIVGWYHSHPGFGVFLSEHDLFIQENFFSSPQQVAWVFDPHTDEEGCFGWVGGKTEKLNGVRFGYSQAVDMSGSAASEYDEGGDSQIDSMVQVHDQGRERDREPAWAKWASRTLMFLAVLGVGFVLGHEYMAYRLAQVAPMLDACKQIADHPAETCIQILRDAGMIAAPGAVPSRLQGPLQPEQAQPKAAPTAAPVAPKAKEPNGKH
ncbi:MAG TPA: Mov34/MPN/PAD-1 family protein [Candidatus Angelobacter sp.]|nr:Mov34/MPN/PAD-1 family protein [Candidatus Angelobacter sp.]